jgi:hypothetical protein
MAGYVEGRLGIDDRNDDQKTRAEVLSARTDPVTSSVTDRQAPSSSCAPPIEARNPVLG